MRVKGSDRGITSLGGRSADPNLHSTPLRRLACSPFTACGAGNVAAEMTIRPEQGFDSALSSLTTPNGVRRLTRS